MKTLDQMEPRTPLVEGADGVAFNPALETFTISKSGSYYLTGNLEVGGGNAITIDADGVSLDLRGFTISSRPTLVEGDGIEIRSRQVAIHDGHIAGANFRYGIFTGGDPNRRPERIRIRDISVEDCRSGGIQFLASYDSLVESCFVADVGGIGISATTVKDCQASRCTGVGISALRAIDSSGSSTGDHGISSPRVTGCNGSTSSADSSHHGITGSSGTRSQFVSNSTGSNGSAGHGIFAVTVNGSTGSATNTSATSVGIKAITVNNSTGRSGQGNGIEAVTVSNCNGESYGLSSSGSGIVASSSVGDSYGEAVNGKGIQAISISNCFAESEGGTGLEASNITNSFGRTTSGTYAINTFGAASYCRAENKSAGTPIAIRASIAIACTVVAGGGTVSAPEKHLGTP